MNAKYYFLGAQVGQMPNFAEFWADFESVEICENQ